MAADVLVTGATGSIGGAVVPRLLAEGVKVRAFVRNTAKALGLAKAGAELAEGAFEQKTSLARAMRGVDTAVLITAPNRNAAKQASALIAAADEAGVRRLVRISVIKADPDGPTDNVQQHGRTDNEILASGMAYTILRPSFFMQNFFFSAETIRDSGQMIWGMGDGRIGMIDVRDIVDATARAVVDDASDDEILDLTGPASISLYDVAAAISDALGRPVTYLPVPPKAVEESLRNMDAWFAEVMRDYSEAYTRGWGDFVTDAVEQLTGHAPRSIEAFAQEVLAPALTG